jgi:hypothetical protein
VYASAGWLVSRVRVGIRVNASVGFRVSFNSDNNFKVAEYFLSTLLVESDIDNNRFVVGFLILEMCI